MSSFYSRWGIKELDDSQFLNVPGWIMRHWSKFVTIQEWSFILQVMSYKYDSSNGEARPSLATIQEQLGYNSIRSVQNVKNKLVKKRMVNVTERTGETSVYDFEPFSRACYKAEFGEAKVIAMNNNAPLHSTAGEGVQTIAGGGVQSDAPKDIEVKIENEKINSASDSQEQSDELANDLLTSKKAKQLISVYRTYSQDMRKAIYGWFLDEAKALVEADITPDDIKGFWDWWNGQDWTSSKPTWSVIVSRIIDWRDEQKKTKSKTTMMITEIDEPRQMVYMGRIPKDESA